jgi:hypothetical protein
VWELVEQENVDEVMRGVQGSSDKTQVERFHALSVRMGVAGPSVMKVGGKAVRRGRTDDLKD